MWTVQKNNIDWFYAVLMMHSHLSPLNSFTNAMQQYSSSCNLTLQLAWSGCDAAFLFSQYWDQCLDYGRLCAPFVSVKDSSMLCQHADFIFCRCSNIIRGVTYHALFEGSVWFHSHRNETLDFLHHPIKLVFIFYMLSLHFKVVLMILRLGTSCMWICGVT